MLSACLECNKSSFDVKNINKILFVIITIIFSFSITLAQSDVQDTSKLRMVKALVIDYDITYPNKKKPIVKAVCYNRSITIIYGSKMYSASFSENGNIYSRISSDCGENTYTIFPNHHFILKYNRNDDPSTSMIHVTRTISTTNNYRHILNYDCGEIKILSNSEVNGDNYTNVNYIYTCDKLDNYHSNYTDYKECTGLMLGSELDMALGAIQRWTAKSITEQMVDSSIFTISPDDTILTMNEYTQKLTTNKAFAKEMNKEFKISGWFTFKTILKVAADVLIGTNLTGGNPNGTSAINDFAKINNKSPNTNETSNNVNNQNTNNYQYNQSMQNEANKVSAEYKKSDKDKYDNYMRQYRLEKADADDDYSRYENSTNASDKAEWLDKYNSASQRAKSDLENAEIWK